VAPGRRADVDPAVAAAVLADTGRLPWLCAVPLADVAASRERCAELPDDQAPADAEVAEAADADAEADADQAVAAPPFGDDAGLPPAFLDRLAQVTRAADQFTEAILVPGLGAGGRHPGPPAARDRPGASSAWREQPLQGRLMLACCRRTSARCAARSAWSAARSR
jgi:hypothetical protein